MRFLSVIAVLVLLAATAQPVQAGMEEDCVQGRNPDLVIGGCTAVIRSGKFTGRNLAISHLNRGIAFNDIGEYRRAIEDYDQALRIDPGFAKPHTGRGIAYNHLGEHYRAIENYEQALRLDPDSAETYFSRGKAYEDLGEYRRAIEDYDRALRIDPGYALAYNNRAWALYIIGYNAEALADADRALSLEPGDANAIDTRAHVLAALGRSREALGEFERAMRIGGANSVRNYQAALARHGYYRGAIDGAYGAGTGAALAACLDAGCRVVE